MARHRSVNKVHPFPRKGSPYWYIWWWENGKRKQKATKRLRSEYSESQMLEIINNETGTKRTVQYSIDWLETHTLYRLEVEGREENTGEGYKQAFSTLKAVYGGGYSILKVDRAAISSIQQHLHERGNRPATINSTLRKLRAAFERVYIDGVIDRNPFYRFKPLHEPKDKRKVFTVDELKRLLTVLGNHKNKGLAHLMRISIFTGLRGGEVLSMTRENVNLNERFYRAVNNKSGDRHLVMREIPEQVIGDFQYFIDKYPSSDYPFRVYTTSKIYGNMVKKLLKQHGFHPDLHLHSFRHTAGTLALEIGGMTVRDVNRNFDHSSMAVTELYLHDSIKRALNIGLK